MNQEVCDLLRTSSQIFKYFNTALHKNSKYDLEKAIETAKDTFGLNWNIKWMIGNCGRACTQLLSSSSDSLFFRKWTIDLAPALTNSSDYVKEDHRFQNMVSLFKLGVGVERGRLKSEEDALRLSAEKGQMDQSLSGTEMDLAETQRQIQQLQELTAEMERSHSQRLIELTTRHHQELEKETGRLRTANQQAERVLEAKERAHRQRVKELEEQVFILQEQLDREMKKRQAYISQMLRSRK
ncbi:ciliary rootlet coiled-coil protein 2-like [Rhinoraja longicauda]